MLSELVMIFTFVCAALVLYHHVGYPLILRLLTHNRTANYPGVPLRRYQHHSNDQDLPAVALLMPAYNEAGFIADKLRNLAALDYPKERLQVVIACDGCRDNTASVARQVAAEPECQHLNVKVIDFSVNRGKLAVINEVVPELTAEVVVLSDVSALVSVDALLVGAAHFANPGVGVVSGSYRLLNPGSEGESRYWEYQRQIKQCESALGSTLGVHGAFYLFRRPLFQPLPDDTINDDFIIPMQIVAQGYRAVYEPRIQALELECADEELDQQRRRRIAAGNVQQLVRLARLLCPRHGGVAFAFASGKALRALMPFCLLGLLVGSALLAVQSPFFLTLLLAQCVVYGLAAYRQFTLPRSAAKPLATVHYLVTGHLAGLIGAIRYLLGLERGRWQKLTTLMGEPE